MAKLNQDVFLNLLHFFKKQKKWKKFFYVILLDFLIFSLILIIFTEKELVLSEKNHKKIEKIDQDILKIKKNKYYSVFQIEKLFKISNSKNIMIKIINLSKDNNLTFSELKPIKHKIQNGFLPISIKANTQCQFLDCIRFINQCNQIPLTIMNEIQLNHKEQNKEPYLTFNFIITTYFRQN